MKVKLLVSRAGSGVVQNVGDVIDVPNDEAKRMMEARPPQCAPVRSTKSKVEKTTKK